MTQETELPALPEPFMELFRELFPHVYAAWADQMRAYATAAVLAEREACAKLCADDPKQYAGYAAAAIRARSAV